MSKNESVQKIGIIVQGEENPADLVTRGTSVQQLINSQHWWHGLSWLLEDTSCWPQNRLSNEPSGESLAEASTEEHSVKCNVAVQETTYPESWQRLLRITAWLVKWARLSGKPKHGRLTALFR